MIDIHNHIIPGLDDGAVDLPMALSMLQMAQEQGVTHLVCTPHMHAGRYDNDIDTIRKHFNRLLEALCHSELSIELAMAAEVRISDDFMYQLTQGKVPFIGQWEGRSAILLEMPHAHIPPGIDRLIEWLQQQGYQPVIAHPERNKDIIKVPQEALALAERGVLFQLTAGSVTGQFGESARATAHWLLTRNLVHFMASDAHRIARRAPAMGEAYADVVQRYGEVMARQLTVINPRKLTASLFNQE
ncbi:capsular biosynthesis protein [Endozoicomonas sp. Mp262]|uniref:tyrosine-protein phosphatase n=1 Tax=Endozoicomonas sp. Mp262 TaxID=2919499 RepID=UPI0021D93D38